jgi:nicotinamide riboside transporter PnuC
MDIARARSGMGVRWFIWVIGGVFAVAIYAGVGAFTYAVGILLLSAVAGELIGRYADQRRH